MKKALILILVTFTISTTYAQVGINADNSAPHSSAQLDVKSTTKAFYPPRMTTAQKDAIVGKQAGAVVYDVTLGALSFYNGSTWNSGTSSGSATLTLPYYQTAIDPVVGFSGLFRLDEIGEGNAGQAILGFSTNGTGISGRSTNYRGISGFSSNGTAGYFNSTSGKSIITGSGNVGIGVSDPLTILDIKSRMRVRHSTETSGIYFDGSTNTYKGFIGMRNDNHIGLYGFNGAGWAFNMNTTNGFVGLGNDAPQEKLHITAGNIRVETLASSGFTQIYANSQGNLQGLSAVAFLAVIESIPTISILKNTYLTVPFNAVKYNLGDFFNTTNNEFIAPVNGIYHFDTFVTFGPISAALSNSRYFIGYLVENVTSSEIYEPMTNTTENKTLTLSQDLKLNAGQKVKVFVNQTSNLNIPLADSELSTKFSGHLVMRL